MQSCAFLSHRTVLNVLLSYWRAISERREQEKIVFKSLNQLNIFPYVSLHHLGIKRLVLTGM